MKVVTSIHIEKGGVELQDRAEIYNMQGRTVIAVADGVGGISGGTLAADTFVYNVQEAVQHLTDAEKCRRLMMQVDRILSGDLNGPETTGIVIVIDSKRLFGAACGDSAARIYRADCEIEVTPSGRSKPFLGRGSALIADFEVELSGTLVVATDGLWKYSKSADIARTIRNTVAERLAAALADLSRLKSGALPDDIAVVTCEPYD